MSEDEFERVYTMTDYWDGPRGGIADFRGRPHLYSSNFDDLEDPWLDSFELKPVDAETLRLALEDWEIWLRWERAFHAGETPLETHPALPADRARHDEIAQLLAARMESLAEPATTMRGEFRTTDRRPEHGVRLEVRWIHVEGQSTATVSG